MSKLLGMSFSVVLRRESYQSPNSWLASPRTILAMAKISRERSKNAKVSTARISMHQANA